MRVELPLLLCAAAVIGLTSSSPRLQHQFSNPGSIPNVEVVRWATRSDADLAVDLYWMRVISVSISIRSKADGLSLIRWAQFLTDLEPRFRHAYLVGALLGSFPAPDGPDLVNATEAAELLEKGAQQLPADCQLAVYLSYFQSQALHAPRAAADTLARAARNSKACPAFVARLTTRLYAVAGDANAAIDFARELSASGAGEDAEFLKERIEALHVEQLLLKVDAASRAWKTAHDSVAPSVEALVMTGLLDAQVLADVGEPVTLDAEGRATVASHERMRLYQSRL